MRAARADDLAALYEMAKLTGGGFTNLPPDRPSLTAKLDRSDAAFARIEEAVTDDLFVLVLENIDSGQVRGTCQIFSQIGMHAPFYSYRIGTLTQHSKELGRTFRADMLTLSTDLEGSSEVGGLFLHPRERAGGLVERRARVRRCGEQLEVRAILDRDLGRECRRAIEDGGLAHLHRVAPEVEHLASERWTVQVVGDQRVVGDLLGRVVGRVVHGTDLRHRW